MERVREVLDGPSGCFPQRLKSLLLLAMMDGLKPVPFEAEFSEGS
jgi:hypothetical protein